MRYLSLVEIVAVWQALLERAIAAVFSTAF